MNVFHLFFFVFSPIKKCPISLLNENPHFPPKRDGNFFFSYKKTKFHGITPLFCRAACCFLAEETKGETEIIWRFNE